MSRELKLLGYLEQRVEDGRVTFVGDELALCRANIGLRCAERVLLKVAEFDAPDFDQLFAGVESVDWASLLPMDASIPVRGRSVRSQLHSVPTCQAMVKKAIAETLLQRSAVDRLPETGPEFPVEFSLLKDRLVLAIDSSGRGLHKRGYRQLTGPAPLRETLAASLVLLSFWNKERPLIDPFCGTGTIPIEAAMIGRRIAPGLNRSFLSEEWPLIPASCWESARTEARDAIRNDLDFTLIGTDHDPKLLSMARYHAEKANVGKNIHFQQKTFDNLTTNRHYGCVITNPPYGERSGELTEAEELYRSMLPVFERMERWSHYLLTSHSQFESLYGRSADRRRKLYNGRIECTYYQFHGPRPPRRLPVDEVTS